MHQPKHLYTINVRYNLKLIKMIETIYTMVIPQQDLEKQTIGIQLAVKHTFKRRHLFGGLPVYVGIWGDADGWGLFDGHDEVEEKDVEEFESWILSDVFKLLCDKGRIIYEFEG